MKNFVLFLSFVATGILMGACARVMVDYLEEPEVHVSHSTGACVRMVEADGTQKPCPKQLPEKYVRIWVK